MTSVTPGKGISEAEVTNVSAHGLWVLVLGEELFLPYSKFPWFSVTNVELLQSHHLYWPDLDIDLHINSIRHPEKFPLLSK
jgi:hypothetical protein